MSAQETFALRGAGAIPAGGTVVDLMATGLLRAQRPDGSVDPAFAVAFPALASAAQLVRPLLQSKGVRFTPEGEQAMAEQGTPVEQGEQPGMVEDYRRLRDTRRLRSAAGSQQNPKAGKAGAAVGTVASMLMPGAPTVRVGAGATTPAGQVAGRLASAGLTGGAYGGLQGATEGDADLTEGEVEQSPRRWLRAHSRAPASASGRWPWRKRCARCGPPSASSR